MPQARLSSDPGHEMAATQAIQWFSYIWRFKMRSFRLCTTPLLLGDTSANQLEPLGDSVRRFHLGSEPNLPNEY